MKWFRHRWEGCWLALFAMALQLILTFGHVHGLSHIALQVEHAVERGLEYASSPQPQHDNEHEEDSCQLCGALKLAGSLVLPAAVELPRPFGNFVSQQIPTNTAFVSTLPGRPYQVRAPPLA